MFENISSVIARGLISAGVHHSCLILQFKTIHLEYNKLKPIDGRMPWWK